jgi:hypothetical protein
MRLLQINVILLLEGYPPNVCAQQGSLSDVRAVFFVISPGLLPQRVIGLLIADCSRNDQVF